MAINKVILIGHLGHDPELKHIKNGQAVCNFSLATTERWKDKNTGAAMEKTEWHRIVAWGRPAETIKQYAQKGSQMYIEGKIRYQTYVDKDGIKRYTTEIHVDEFNFLSRAAVKKDPDYTGIQLPTEDDIPY